jgi:hypothetical protein
MIDADDTNDDVHHGPGPYPQQYDQVTTMSQVGYSMPATSVEEMTQAQGGFGTMFDPADPMLDADPFGLTASMHFPTPFSFQESSMRK